MSLLTDIVLANLTGLNKEASLRGRLRLLSKKTKNLLGASRRLERTGRLVGKGRAHGFGHNIYMELGSVPGSQDAARKSFLKTGYFKDPSYQRVLDNVIPTPIEAGIINSSMRSSSGWNPMTKRVHMSANTENRFKKMLEKYKISGSSTAERGLDKLLPKSGGLRQNFEASRARWDAELGALNKGKALTNMTPKTMTSSEFKFNNAKRVAHPFKKNVWEKPAYLNNDNWAEDWSKFYDEKYFNPANKRGI